MKILLTGGAGYIGSHTAIALRDAEHSFVIYDDLSNSSAATITSLEAIIGDKVEFIEGNILNTQLLEDILRQHQIDAVIHLAGLKAVGESVEHPFAYYENNVQGTLSLLRAMRQRNVKNLVFSSSATVYGNPQYLPIDEAHSLAPTSPYGRTKLQVEQILRDLAFADEGWRIANLRYFNPAGAHPLGLLGENPKGSPNNLMPYIARVAAGELPDLKVFGGDYPTIDGTGVRDYIHVMDLAEGHVAALSFLATHPGFEIFNLGTGIGYSVLQIVHEFESASGREIPHQIVGKRSGDIASCFADPSRANRLLAWNASRTISDMCSSSWLFQQKSLN